MSNIINESCALNRDYHLAIARRFSKLYVWKWYFI